MSARETAADRRTGLALLLGPILALALYVVLFLALLIGFSAISDELSRDRIWKVLIFWAIFSAPSMLAPAGAALLTGAILGARARRASFWPILLLLLAFTAITILWSLLSGGGWGVLAALFQAGSTALGWRWLNAAAGDRGA